MWAREARRAVEERRGRIRRVRVRVGVVGSGEAGVEMVEEEEAMVKGLRRSFSQGLVGEVGGRLR